VAQLLSRKPRRHGDTEGARRWGDCRTQGSISIQASHGLSMRRFLAKAGSNTPSDARGGRPSQPFAARSVAETHPRATSPSLHSRRPFRRPTRESCRPRPGGAVQLNLEPGASATPGSVHAAAAHGLTPHPTPQGLTPERDLEQGAPGWRSTLAGRASTHSGPASEGAVAPPPHPLQRRSGARTEALRGISEGIGQAAPTPEACQEARLSGGGRPRRRRPPGALLCSCDRRYAPRGRAQPPSRTFRQLS